MRLNYVPSSEPLDISAEQLTPPPPHPDQGQEEGLSDTNVYEP